jgi:hypothetical protein
MNITAYTDTETHALIDDALEQLARHREVSPASDTGLLSLLLSLAQQVNEMIEHALAEADLGIEVTLDDIADVLGITASQARQRYSSTTAGF